MARLFGSSGVSGLVNIDLTPALACKAGLAVASQGESLKAAKDIMGKGTVLVTKQVEEWKR